MQVSSEGKVFCQSCDILDISQPEHIYMFTCVFTLTFMFLLQDDEYVVYSPDQVKLKYVVQFSVEGDQLKEFNPDVNTSAGMRLPSSDRDEQGISKNQKGIVLLRIKITSYCLCRLSRFLFSRGIVEKPSVTLKVIFKPLS